MLNKVLLVGCKGSMGVRYQAILKALGVTCVGVDRDDDWPDLKGFDAAIVASPTETHTGFAATLCREKLPVLVEKPISINPLTAANFCDEAVAENFKVRMVNQYLYMPRGPEIKAFQGGTLYDYFRSGKDGLVYDCISILALASGPISLNDKSPVWRCVINGQPLSLADMDRAYFDMVKRFLTEPPEGPETSYIRMAQDKAAKVAAEAWFGN